MRELAEQREARFFFFTAIAFATIVVAGFVMFIITGRSTFSAPWWVHLHAVTYMAWLGLYLSQTYFIYADKRANHRVMGKIGAGLAIWMIVSGAVFLPYTVMVGRTPPFFTPAFFLALDALNILVFGLLITLGLFMRHKTHWHRRLMFAATLSIGTPGVGRIALVLEIEAAIVVSAVMLGFLLGGMVFDGINKKRFYPAYLVGLIPIMAMGPLTEVLAKTAFMGEVVSWLQ
ncbi:hypothetical protein DRW07_10355 [Alteromonas sediminis]|uniref:DUF2306 domain-containing protein n=1 Tax=Alteromonas sediminis TaxID=2259342 RepID=A0A3N5XZ09_9ALTE|nr:hypothetical protein [Alteromonas sediminis]RPJ66487.1 hypothetical protein DRW07_10355 [Alteromonas sediminis]